MARCATVPRPLLLVHGIGDTHRTWRDVVPRLEGALECSAVDLPGFGATPPLSGPPTMAALASWCRDHMAERGHERFHVAGNSLGGGIALWLALSGAVDSACALSPVGFTEGLDRAYLHLSLRLTRATARTNARIVPLLPGAARKAMFAQYVAHGDRIPAERFTETLQQLAGARGFAATQRHALNWRCPSADALPCRVTVAWADRDRLLPRGRQAARARRRLPSAHHLLLHDCGHLPGLDDPAQTAAVIREAVRSGG